LEKKIGYSYKRVEGYFTGSNHYTVEEVVWPISISEWLCCTAAIKLTYFIHLYRKWYKFRKSGFFTCLRSDFFVDQISGTLVKSVICNMWFSSLKFYFYFKLII
jgi:hypothetical protein